MAPALIR